MVYLHREWFPHPIGSIYFPWCNIHSTPRDIIPPEKLCLLEVLLTPRTTTPARDLVFKHMRLWGAVSFMCGLFHSNPILLNEQQMWTLMFEPNTLFLWPFQIFFITCCLKLIVEGTRQQKELVTRLGLYTGETKTNIQVVSFPTIWSYLHSYSLHEWWLAVRKEK